jgi:hypothetical protein
MREWLKLMLEEIRRREAEERLAKPDAAGSDGQPPSPPGEPGPSPEPTSPRPGPAE